MTDPAWIEALRPFVEWAQANRALAAHLAFGLPLLVLFLTHLVLRRRAVAPLPPPRPQPEPPPAAPQRQVEPAATPEPIPEPVAAAPAPEPVATEPEPVAAVPEPEPEPVAAVPEPEPEPVAAVPEPEPEPPVVAPAPEREVVAPAPAPQPEPAAPDVSIPAPRPLRERLARTSQALVGRLGSLLGGRKVDEELLEDLEAVLFTADLGVATAEALLEEVREKARGQDADAVRGLLREAIAERLRRIEPEAEDRLELRARPHVILVLGVNGSGKTTTIGKLAARYRAAGHRVVLGAGDTFRAAAIEQLQTWGERTGCEVVAGAQGGDPAAVAFDTVKAAVAREADVAIVDTAGRLQTKKPLMEELSKIARVLGRDLEGAPHETLLVLDSNTGQNAISQAREFTAAAEVTGLVLTKLDGSAKGGVIVGLADEFGIPVKFVGVGEGVEDLRDFRADEFVEALFAE